MGSQQSHLRLLKWLTLVMFFSGLTFVSWWLYEGVGYFRDEMYTQDNFGPLHGPRLALPDGTVPFQGQGYDWRLLHLRPRPPLRVDPALGARLYHDNCSFCHGVDGRGDAPVGLEYDPAPPDLNLSVARSSPARLFRAISDGMPSAPAIDVEPDPGANWHAYRLYLDESQRRQILAYLEAHFGPGKNPGAPVSTTVRHPCGNVAGNPPCP